MRTISTEQRNEALEQLSWNEDAKVEHLLKFDVFYIKDKEELLEWVSTFTQEMWRHQGITAAYNGYTTYKTKKGETLISEVFFRTDKVVDGEELLEQISWDVSHNVMFLGVEQKSMVCDDLADVYLDLDYHFDYYGPQALYSYTDEQMHDIFGEDAQMFMEMSN